MIRCVVIIAVALVAGGVPGWAQSSPSGAAQPPRPLIAARDNTLEVWGGLGIPKSHTSFTNFWKQGPAAGILLSSRATDNLKLGFGIEVTLFSFRLGAFIVRYPTAPIVNRNQVLVHLSLSIRNYFRPFERLSPYLGADVGFARISGAENKEIINGVRKIYYDVPGAIRLALGGVAGVDYYLSTNFALQADIRGVYLHNDSNVGVILTPRLGVKFKL